MGPNTRPRFDLRLRALRRQKRNVVRTMDSIDAAIKDLSKRAEDSRDIIRTVDMVIKTRLAIRNVAINIRDDHAARQRLMEEEMSLYILRISRQQEKCECIIFSQYKYTADLLKTV